MLAANQSRMAFQLNQFYNDRVLGRKLSIARSVREVCRCVQDVLREVETQEPRFISSLQEVDGGHFDGVRVVSPTEFEVILYLNQMGIFNFVDDGAVPGCAVLKLSDGRKRSMSLWVEFITASGYLSARKIRSRFQTLVAQAVEKCAAAAAAATAATLGGGGGTGGGNGSSCPTATATASVKMVPDTTEVRLRVRDRYIVQITPAFKCVGIWPRSAAHWPVPSGPGSSAIEVVVGGIRQISSPPMSAAPPWPSAALVAEVKAEGFDLLSKESPYSGCAGGTAGRDKQPSTDGDAWIISFHQAESLLLAGGSRRRCLSVLKTLRDRHLDLPGRPVDNYHLTTLVLHECEKHPRDSDWDELCLGDRVNGVLLQLISCLQNRRCPHYFLPGLDLFKARSPAALDSAARQAWRILRELVTNSRGLEKL